MALECTARVMAGGRYHEHIARLYYTNGGFSGSMTRAEMVAYVERNGTDSAWCPDKNGGPSAWVHVSHNGTTKYVQTYADGRWTNNLLSLPERAS